MASSRRVIHAIRHVPEEALAGTSPELRALLEAAAWTVNVHVVPGRADARELNVSVTLEPNNAARELDRVARRI